MILKRRFRVVLIHGGSVVNTILVLRGHDRIWNELSFPELLDLELKRL